MHGRHWHKVVRLAGRDGIVATTMAVLLSGGVTAAPQPGPGSGSNPGGAITVDANHLLRDGSVYTPHGLISIAFVAPPAAQHGVFTAAYAHFEPAEMTAMRDWGADSVRFQVSQPGVDPQNALYTADFVTRVRDAVRAARAAGLTVLVSIQDESQSGETRPAALPDAATGRAWQTLAPYFNDDPGVLYELINEPRLPVSPRNWRAWAAAMNTTIAVIRATGSRNVVIADGLEFAERLDGAPVLDDPVHAVAYGWHPYFHQAKGQTQAEWTRKLGDTARRAPVVVTEWTTVPNYYCDADTAAAALRFMAFLDANGIGLTAYAYDFAGPKFGSALHGFPPVASSFVGTQCGDAGYGPGKSIQDWYRSGRVPETLR